MEYAELAAAVISGLLSVFAVTVAVRKQAPPPPPPPPPPPVREELVQVGNRIIRVKR